MRINLLSHDQDTGYAEIELHLDVSGETKVFRQMVILPTDNDAKMRSILKKYGEDYEASLNNDTTPAPIAKDVTATPSVTTRIKDAAQAIKRIF